MISFEQAARAAVATRLSQSARANYARSLDAWLAHCADAAVDPEQPTADAAAAFRDSLRVKRYKPRGPHKSRKYSSATVWNYLSALSFIHSYVLAQRATKLTWNPFDTKALPRPPVSKEGITEDVSKETAERMIKAARDAGALRDAALLQLLYSTGARRMSIASLRRDALRERDGKVFARIQTKGSGGAELDEIVIPAEAVAALAAWLAAAPKSLFVFPGRDRGSSINLSVANKAVTRWAEATGAHHVHPHRFRVAFITSGFDAKIPARDLAASVGHRELRSTLRYDRGVRGGDVAEAIAAHRHRGEKARRPTKKGKVDDTGG